MPLSEKQIKIRDRIAIGVIIVSLLNLAHELPIFIQRITNKSETVQLVAEDVSQEIETEQGIDLDLTYLSISKIETTLISHGRYSELVVTVTLPDVINMDNYRFSYIVPLAVTSKQSLWLLDKSMRSEGGETAYKLLDVVVFNEDEGFILGDFNAVQTDEQVLTLTVTIFPDSQNLPTASNRAQKHDRINV